MPSPEYTPSPETAEEAFELRYRELSRLMARVSNQIVGLHNSNRKKTWADVGDLGQIIEVMQELDKFLRSRRE